MTKNEIEALCTEVALWHDTAPRRRQLGENILNSVIMQCSTGRRMTNSQVADFLHRCETGQTGKGLFDKPSSEQ